MKCLWHCIFFCISVSQCVAETYQLSLAGLRPSLMALPVSHDYPIGDVISSAGDFDGNGYIDVLIGVPRFSTQGYGDMASHGAAFLVFGEHIDPVDGHVDLINHSQAVLQLTGRPGAKLGNAVATLGDMNADGYSDVGVGIANELLGLILYGDESGPRSIQMPDLTGVLSTQVQFTGQSVHEAGDSNSDGYPDAVFGHPVSEGEHETGVGRVALIYGGETIPPRLDTREAGTHVVPFRGLPGGRLGESVTGAMIFNNDGFADVAMLAAKGGSEGKGRAFLLPGSEDVVTSFEQAHVIEAAQRFVQTVGDLNGDFYTDIAVGTEDGGAWVIWGGESVPRTIDLTTADTADWGIRLDYAPTLEGIGDIDGDGFDDLAVGLPDEDVGDLPHAGRLMVLFGGDSWPGVIPIHERLQGEAYQPSALIIDGARAFGRFGASISFAGDMRGEGFNDFLVGAPSLPFEDQSGNRVPGHVYVLRGQLIHLFLQNPNLLSTM